jgi:hypothetical protein
VARDLKYSNQEMDLESLAKELHGEKQIDNGFDDQDFNFESKNSNRN